MTYLSSSHIPETEIVHQLSLSQSSSNLPEQIMPGFEAPRPAAVLVPLIYNPPDAIIPGWHVLYTRRTDLVQDHKGQVSFPGGRADPEDTTSVDTALREAYEEIGLVPSDVKILGEMNPFLTITNYLVTPVIGIIPWPYTFRLQPQEVSRVFTMPMDWMAKPENYEIRQREFPSSLHLPSQFKHLQVIYFRQYDGETLWGVTAEVTLRLLHLLGMT